MGICDTRLNQKNANFACQSDKNYRTHWTPKLPNSTSGGLGIIIHEQYNRFVQKTTRWSDRILALDLFISGRNKLRIINVYIPPKNSISYNKSLRQQTINETLRLVKEVSNSHCIVMGDFNMDLDDFTFMANQGHRIPSSYNLFLYLRNHNFIDSHPTFDDYTIPTFIRKDSSTHLPISISRLDTIWISSSLSPDILYAETWDTEAFHNTDHNMVISYLAKNLLFDSLSEARLNQKREKRKAFVYKSMTLDKWTEFAQGTDIFLALQISKFPTPIRDSLPINELNRKWQILQTAIIKSANDHIPQKWVSPKKSNRIWESLQNLYADISTLNRIISYLSNRRILTNSLPGAFKWHIYLDSINKINSRCGLNPLNLPDTLTTVNCSDIKRSLLTLKALLFSKARIEEQSWTNEQVKMQADIRCDNYSDNPSKFIDSSLNRTKR